MRVATLNYNANQPTLQQIIVPTNSKYAVGVRISKDGEIAAVKSSELSVNGVAASEQIHGFNVVQLSSDGTEGIKSFDVNMQTGINVVGEVSAIAINSGTRPKQMVYSSESYLSDFISEPTYLKASDFNVLGTFVKPSTETEWTETSSYVFCCPWRVSMTNGAATYYVAQFNADGVREVGWYNGDLVKQGYEYLEV